MDGRVKVDFGAVGELGAGIDGRVRTIDTQLGDLHQQISSLEQIWQGGASAGFQAEKQKWEQASQDLNQTLARIATAVHTANDNYQQTEKSNAARWNH